MARTELPLLVEPVELAAHLGDPGIRVVDVNPPNVYLRAHVPGAAALDYSRIIAERPPAKAMLPDAGQLADVLGDLGLTPEHHVIAYDDEGNGRAARLLWTLDVLGHRRASLLNGGLRAWLAEHQPTESGTTAITPTRYPVQLGNEAVADKDYVLAHLRDPGVLLLDSRSPDEYAGVMKRAARAGHIPGAVNFHWTDAMDPARHLRLKTPAELRRALEAVGATPEKEIITYCQTHHRSAHTYVALKSLGYPRVKGYPGSWSEWGNLPDTPIE